MCTVLALVWGAGSAGAAPGVDLPAVAGRASVEMPDDLARGWDAVERLTGVEIAALVERAGLPPAAREALPPAPDALVRALRSSVAVRQADALAESEDDAAGDAADDEPPPPFAATGAVGDLTGDGTTDVWLRNGVSGGPVYTSLVDGASGRRVWRQPSSLSGPMVIADADGDGVRDVVAYSWELVDIRDIEDFEGEDREAGFEFVFSTTLAALSGATGQTLWSETDTETFGLSFFGRYTTTEYSFGMKVWLDNALLDTAAVRVDGPDKLIVQRVDQRASAQSGGRGVYVWSDDPALSGVRVTDTAKVTFAGATRARLAHAADGTTDRIFERPEGEGVAFLLAANDTGASLTDVLWVSLDLPEQRFECVEGTCLESIAANGSTTIELYGTDGVQRWRKQYTGRYATDVWYGDDQTGDGRHDLLLVDIMPAGDSYDVQLASLGGADGAEQWRTPLGATEAAITDVLPRPAGGSVILMDELLTGSGQFALRLSRVEAATGAVGTVTTHAVEYPPRPTRLPLDDAPYVGATSSVLALDIGGDTDGDGAGDVLVSAWQERHWSDDREPTYWGAWTVESAATGTAIHTRAADDARQLLGWADTTGDGAAEFREYIGATDVIRVLDGRTAGPLWEMDGNSALTTIDDLSGDGVTDMITTMSSGVSGHVVRVLDGPTRGTLWELDVPAP